MIHQSPAFHQTQRLPRGNVPAIKEFQKYPFREETIWPRQAFLCNLYIPVGLEYGMLAEIDSSNGRVEEGSSRWIGTGLVDRFTMERIERVPS